MARLIRMSDGKGDSGSNVEAIRLNPETDNPEYKHTREPIVGWALRVGSVTARTYSNQDWWMTTPVTEIMERTEKDNELYVKFKTGNSIYEFWN